MNYAELEIGLHRGYGNGYALKLRAVQPDSVTEEHLPREGEIPVDLAGFLQVPAAIARRATDPHVVLTCSAIGELDVAWHAELEVEPRVPVQPDGNRLRGPGEPLGHQRGCEVLDR